VLLAVITKVLNAQNSPTTGSPTVTLLWLRLRYYQNKQNVAIDNNKYSTQF